MIEKTTENEPMNALSQLASSENAAYELETLTRQEAAQFLKVTVDWLDRARTAGRGPRFSRLGPKTIRYTRRDLIAWRDGNLHSSTSEYTGDSTGG